LLLFPFIIRLLSVSNNNKDARINFKKTPYQKQEKIHVKKQRTATIQGHSYEEEEEEEVRKVSSAEAINSVDSLLLYLRQEELNIKLQTLSKLRKSILGNIMQKKTNSHSRLYLILK